MELRVTSVEVSGFVVVAGHVDDKPVKPRRALHRAGPVGAHGPLQILSLLSQILYDLPGPPMDAVLVPQAALVRGGRLLDATAELLRQGGAVSTELPDGSAGGLATAFARDAAVLRALWEQHGTPAGPAHGS